MRVFLWLAACGVAWAGEGPGALDRAYEALRAGEYDAAVAGFRAAIAAEPSRAAVRKDLAYTYLKIGENESAREEFGEAWRIDPSDEHAGLEYAFLCYETKLEAEARRIFLKLRESRDPEVRATAARAFENVDRPLAEGIARWRAAVEQSPDNFSGHHELARLAEQRDEIALAAAHYERAWRLRPEKRSLMLDLGRVWKALGREEEALALLLAASRGAEPRTAEEARMLLPGRYPYVYEFRRALELDSENVELRRELAYLHLAMGQRAEAEQEFALLVAAAPEDLLSTAQLGFLRLARDDAEGAMPLLERVLQGDDEELADRVRQTLKLPQTLRGRRETPRRQVAVEAKTLAERSLDAGYLKDALKYLRVAHETDPVDFDVMLKLGWTHNILQQDGEAVRWFGLAKNSPDTAVAQEAERAYRNLQAQEARFRTTAWVLPFFSSRWNNVFSYGQVKAEWRLGKLPLRPYLSSRIVGDLRGAAGLQQSQGVQPQFLSENSVIVGAGVATNAWRGISAWAEGGPSFSYLGRRHDLAAVIPDFRAGLNASRGIGRLLGGERAGLFAEATFDSVFLSRFQSDVLFYLQTRGGYTLPAWEALDGLQVQLHWNQNGTTDRLRQYWANFVESGPGLRLRTRSMPRSLFFSAAFLWGRHTVQEGNPRPRHFTDLRVGFWYAHTR
ncbi:MAG: tetratricopeptide repeat protein [Bryobacteraceae bacterium]